MNQHPLTGITVLDFGQVYNGPYCGFLLAQAGARVIKVEARRGETLRGRGRRSAASYPFALLNSNKEGVTLNIQSEDGQKLLKEMVKHVDVVSENFAPGTMDKYGIGADVLRKINPKLIYASSTGYGSGEGPYRDYLGMDLTIQAMSGSMSVTGEEGGPPLKCGAAYTDFMGGVHLYAGIVAALFARERTGEGATVDISMQDCVFPTLATALGSFYLADQVQAPRRGSRHPGLALAPYNTYPTIDGHVAIICIREAHWRRLCVAMGNEDLADDPRFAKNKDRCEHIDVLDETIAAWSQQLSKAEVFARTQAEGVICAPVSTLADIIEDEHLIARGTLKKRPHPEFGEINQAQSPIRYKELAPRELTDAPELGADNASVYGELAGVAPDALDRLRANEAI